MSDYRNLEIYSVGSQSGGRFAKVLIAGSGKINGDVECDSFELPGAGKIEGGSLTVHGPIEINGAGKVEGAVRCGSLEVNGSFKIGKDCEIHGDLEVNGSFKVEGGPCSVGGSAEIDGSFAVEGPLNVGKLEADGSVKIEGGIRATEIEVDGVLKSDGAVQAERFRAKGSVSIDGLLNAESVELLLSGEDLIESIGGGSVTVRRGDSSFGLFVRKRPHLVTNLIEADEIDLEYTDARTVRGVNVRIGPECVIDRVEYSGSLYVDPNASVREKVHI